MASLETPEGNLQGDKACSSLKPSFTSRFHIFDRVVPILLFFLSMAIRLPVIDHGLPYLDNYGWDEPFIMNPAVDTVRSGNWDPGWQMYPGGPIHLHTLVAGYTIVNLASRGRMYYPSTIKTATDTKYLWTVGLTEIYRNSRVFQAILVSLAIVVLYFIVRTHVGPGEGIIAALLLAVATPLIEVSVQIKPDAPAFLAVTIVLFLSFRVLESRDPRWKHFLLLAVSGLMCGVAAGMKYNAVICLVLPLTACLLNPHHREEGLLIRYAAILLASIIGFVVTSPFSVLRFNEFVRDFADANYIYSAGLTGRWGKWYTNLGKYFADSVTRVYGFPLLVFVPAGLIVLVRRDWRQLFLLVGYWCVLVYLNSAIGTYAYQNYIAGTLVIVILMAVGFGSLPKWAAKRLTIQGSWLSRVLYLVVGVMICLPPTIKAFDLVRNLRSREDSRTVLLNMLANEFPRSDKVAIAEHLRVIIPEAWNGPQLIITNVFNKPYSWFRDQGIKYVVLPERYETTDDNDEGRVVTDWMDNRFRNLSTVLQIQGIPFEFKRILWNPSIVMKRFDSYEEPPRIKRVLPGVAMWTEGRAFLQDHARGCGVELWSKGRMSGLVELDTTCTALRLWGASYWRHPSHACITISVAEQKNQAVRMKLAEDLTI
ncbi:MAG: glycosyltransferase family 39 protein, partial [Candidatus Sumerlaea chitinivorans]|nr:glycosyltransferase family 39 protein [Candidatus Sumerlaea chitinivorans]